jgi:multidrug resistance efflux pump
MEQMMELLKTMQEMMERQIGSLASRVDTNQANIKEIKADIKTSQAKADASLREMREEVRVSQELLKEEILARSDAHHKRMMARVLFQLEKMVACLGEMEAMDLEANSEEIKSKTEHEEVPKEEAVLETFGALKEWYGDWHLAVRRRSQLKKQTQGNGGSWKKLAVACG